MSGKQRETWTWTCSPKVTLSASTRCPEHEGTRCQYQKKAWLSKQRRAKLGDITFVSFLAQHYSGSGDTLSRWGSCGKNCKIVFLFLYPSHPATWVTMTVHRVARGIPEDDLIPCHLEKSAHKLFPFLMINSRCEQSFRQAFQFFSFDFPKNMPCVKL